MRFLKLVALSSLALLGITDRRGGLPFFFDSPTARPSKDDALDINPLIISGGVKFRF